MGPSEANKETNRLTPVEHSSLLTKINPFHMRRQEKIRDNFCNDDRHSAVKLAKVYRSGLAKEVWQSDAKTLKYREVFFSRP
jgi:hypothetical protein